MIRYLLISFLFTEVMATSAKTLICSTYKPRNLNLKKKKITLKKLEAANSGVCFIFKT